MTIDFISDLHLDKTRPKVNKYFINYLDNINKDVTDLYILGDLFEYWVGDDDPMDGLNEIRASISLLGSKINVWYMHGNRDFLISKKICLNLNMHLLQDPTIITKNGQKLLLLHGDTLCTADKQYQRFRLIARGPLLRFILTNLPITFRQKIAEILRSKSKKLNANKSENIMDVSISEVDRIMDKYNANIMIHGHTHRPRIHEQQFGKRFVLGDWDKNGWFIRISNEENFDLISFKIGD